MRHLAGRIYLWLGLGVQTDSLCVAAALKVESAAFRPAVLVVTDQHAGGVRGEGRFAGTGEAKEDSRIHWVARRVVG